MSTREERNKMLARRLFDEGWNGDHAVFDQVVTDDFQIHFAAGSAEVLGVAGAKEMVVDLHAALRGFRCHIEDMVAEQDRVVVRVTYSGEGVALSKILILRLQGERITEVWEDFDPLPILRRSTTMR
jgi:predicted ester cyclase